jgi:hypothetical protein
LHELDVFLERVHHRVAAKDEVVHVLRGHLVELVEWEDLEAVVVVRGVAVQGL